VIDQTSIKSPAWLRVVTELSAPAADDRSYLERLTRIIAQVSSAKQAALLVPAMGTAASGSGPGELTARVMFAWAAGQLAVPGQPQPAAAAPAADGKIDPANLDQPMSMTKVALAVFEQPQSRIFTLDGSRAMTTDTALYEDTPRPAAAGQPSGHLIGLPLMGEQGRCAACVVLYLEARSRSALQSTVAMAEVLMGYVQVHALRQESKRLSQQAMSLELGSRLLSAVNTNKRFRGAAMQVVNDLVRQMGADRAAMGWVQDSGRVKVVALSDAEHFDVRTKMIRQLSEVMDECCDQEQAVLYPPPEATEDTLLSHAVTGAHRELAKSEPGMHVCSVPIRTAEKTVGVLTVELKSRPAAGGKPAAKLDLRGVEILQSAMDLVSPVLALKKSDDRILPLRAIDDSKRLGRWLVGPIHTGWKIGGLVALIGLLALIFVRIPHQISGSANLVAEQRRTISATQEGVIFKIGDGIEPGAEIKKGDLLVQLDTRELEVQRRGAEARMEQAERSMATARRDGKTADAALAEKQYDRALAERELIDVRIGLSRITSPIDGIIVAGELKDKVGSSIKLGDGLLQVAPIGKTGDLHVLARVDERDIHLVRQGAVARLALRTRPHEPIDIAIDQIVPLAEAKDGKNAFAVRGHLVTRTDKSDAGTATAGPAWLRPGMEGIVNIESERRSLLWILSRRVVDTVRLWLW
jgi:multidrug resistance efflux pump